jgi:phenylacetic acid degradation operon negative regulatory protein
VLVQIRPLSARSVVLSLLLGHHPPELPASVLVGAGSYFGISEPTLRVALTRMVAAQDLSRTENGYRLSPRMLERQRRQDAGLDPEGRDWDGSWETLVVTSTGRSAGDRAELRSTLHGLRLAELREGVWMRPANLARPLPAWPHGLITLLHGTPDDPLGLAARLWDLTGWVRAGETLLTEVGTATEPAQKLAVAAALVRHLRTDPALPAAMLPDDWNGDQLLTVYASYREELAETALAVTTQV